VVPESSNGNTNDTGADSPPALPSMPSQSQSESESVQ
jgi:hypothetical protein